MPLLNQLEVDLSAIRHNFLTLKNIVGSWPFYPVIKFNAYGLGQAPIVHTLLQENINEMIVLNVEEAHRLKNFRSLKLLIMEPCLENDIPYLLKNSKFCQPIIGSWDTLQKIYSLKSQSSSFHKIRSLFKTTLSVHIKVEMGLSRFGFSSTDIPKIIEFFKSQDLIQWEGLCGHLPGGKDIGVANGETIQQVNKFQQILKTVRQHFPSVKPHLFNSIGLIGYYSYGIPVPFGARVGGAGYGIKHQVDFNEKAKQKWSSLNIKPVCCLKSQVVSIKKIKKGQGVSYEGDWKASTPSVIATVPMGYAEGFLKTKPKGHFVLIRGQKYPVVGKVCMNCFMVDVTKAENLQVGEEVVIFGEQQGQSIPIEDWVSREGTPYEVMTRIHPSVQRIYKKLV